MRDKRRELDEQLAQAPNVAGTKAYNQVENLEAEIRRLKNIIEDQNQELLQLYRRLNPERDY